MNFFFNICSSICLSEEDSAPTRRCQKSREWGALGAAVPENPPGGAGWCSKSPAAVPAAWPAEQHGHSWARELGAAATAASEVCRERGKPGGWAAGCRTGVPGPGRTVRAVSIPGRESWPRITFGAVPVAHPVAHPCGTSHGTLHQPSTSSPCPPPGAWDRAAVAPQRYLARNHVPEGSEGMNACGITGTCATTEGGRIVLLGLPRSQLLQKGTLCRPHGAPHLPEATVCHTQTLFRLLTNE